MGFADYLSRHPNSPATGKNIYENHIINTIAALQYTLNTAHRKLTNQIARKKETNNDAINNSNSKKTKHNAFCHLHAIKQSPSLVLNNSHNKQLIPKHINKNNFISKLQLDPLLRKKYTSQQETDQK